MKARKTTREEALKTKLNASTDHVPLVVTYNPALPNLYTKFSTTISIFYTNLPNARASLKKPRSLPIGVGEVFHRC